MTAMIQWIFGTAAAFLLASGAPAQTIAAAPTLQGYPSIHAWTILGAKNDGALRTAITCTNTLRSSVIVGVEVFDSLASSLNDASATSVQLGQGETAVFTTGNIAAFFPADGLLVTGLFNAGFARVLITNRAAAIPHILCSAVLADPSTTPPLSMISLPVVRRTTQSGE